MTGNRNEIEGNLRLHVDRLAGLIGPRTLQKPQTIQATIGYIEGQWAEMGYTNDRECYDALGDEATNLIVEQPGSNRANEIVLLGAHYDTVCSTPGADDNASAVAVLLEVSRLLREHTGKRTARYVAFACEEPPYFNVDAMGSQHHARRLHPGWLVCMEHPDASLNQLPPILFGSLRIDLDQHSLIGCVADQVQRFGIRGVVSVYVYLDA
ncbi:Aminopeptidase YwaD precursor [Allorhodopirellula solitaria]|uniref:Aminopeptidase YwaD n=1 Tax=Allorhodopirellula solitaria TaxID=2527987 RepID=A0A5C5XVG8_9BACT|nr:Aminopeptidase YwaD precursor [Allorhodopirellula solitaria]